MGAGCLRSKARQYHEIPRQFNAAATRCGPPEGDKSLPSVPVTTVRPSLGNPAIGLLRSRGRSRSRSRGRGRSRMRSLGRGEGLRPLPALRYLICDRLDVRMGLNRPLLRKLNLLLQFTHLNPLRANLAVQLLDLGIFPQALLEFDEGRKFILGHDAVK